MEILDIINKYNYHKQEEKKHKLEAKILNEQLKNYLRDNENKTIQTNEAEVEYYISTRKKINTNKLIDILEKHNLKTYIEYTPTVTEEVIIDLIREGKIDAEEVAEAIEMKEIENIKLKQIESE